MRFGFDIYQYMVPLAFIAIWAMTSIFNRETQPLPPDPADPRAERAPPRTEPVERLASGTDLPRSRPPPAPPARVRAAPRGSASAATTRS